MAMLKKSAFTLAETLLTLGIIGIVAAITIPVLYNNYQKAQQVVGVKKAYSQLEQFFKKYIVDEGVENLSQTYMFDHGQDFSRLDEVIPKYFNIVKHCPYGATVKSCQITEKYLFASGSTNNFKDWPTYCTADGMCFEIYMNGGLECDPHASCSGKMKGACGIIYLDINGPKPPNKYGRDYFSDLYLDSYGNIYPGNGKILGEYAQCEDAGISSQESWEDYPEECGSPNQNLVDPVYGWGCAARIMEEGWEMNY